MAMDTTAVSLFRGMDAAVTIRDSATTPNSQTITGDITSFNISGGAREAEQIVAFGDTRFFERKVYEPFEIEIGLIRTTILADQVLYGGELSDGDLETGDSVTIGASTTDEEYDIQLVLSNGEDYFGFVFLNASAVSLNDTLASDGKMESTLNFKVIPSSTNVKRQFTKNKTTSPLTITFA